MKQNLVVGDTLDFSTEVVDYPPSAGWTLKFRLAPIGSTGTAIDLTTTADSNDYHRVQKTATQTATWGTGKYSWQSFVTKGTGADLIQFSVDSGIITLDPNPLTIAVGTDTRTHARKVLDAIEATIEGRATHDMAQYMIQGRQVTLLGPDQLIRWRGYYRSIVNAEEVRSGHRAPGGLRVKFQR